MPTYTLFSLDRVTISRHDQRMSRPKGAKNALNVSAEQWTEIETLLRKLELTEDDLESAEDGDKVISFRATIEEWNWLQQRASIDCGISRARYLRLLFLSHQQAIGV